MSYILEALGKAEKTRKQDQLKQLSSDLYRPNEPSPIPYWLKSLGLLLLPIAFFALGYYARPYLEGIRVSYTGQDAATPSHSEPLPVELTTALRPKIISSDAPPETVLQAPQTPKPPATSDSVLSVISFSEVAAERFAMINGVFAKQGDVLSSGEKVVQIDKNSALLKQGDRSYILTVN